MTIYEARKACRDYYNLTNPSEEDKFLYTEALRFLMEETKDSDYMLELGGFYYEERRFDLALKYYELAAAYDNLSAIIGLGYIWYYGRTGERNYEKAFHYYNRGYLAGDLVAAYKVADMYKNGYFVQKDEQKYREIIEELYPKVRNLHMLGDPVPEIYTRLAKLRAEDGNTEEALRLYDEARDFLAQRIRANPFFGNLNIMKWMIEDIYRLRPFDGDSMDLYDLYYVLRSPVKVRFMFEGKTHEVEAVEEDGVLSIRFDEGWYRSVDSFFRSAELEGELLTARYEELYDFQLTGSDDHGTN